MANAKEVTDKMTDRLTRMLGAVGIRVSMNYSPYRSLEEVLSWQFDAKIHGIYFCQVMRVSKYHLEREANWEYLVDDWATTVTMNVMKRAIVPIPAPDPPTDHPAELIPGDFYRA